MSEHVSEYLEAIRTATRAIHPAQLDELVGGLARVRADGGRLFVLGVGGGAGHASHAVNDFRKLCDIEAYCPADNVSELTARINDHGWEHVYSDWLTTSRLRAGDALLVFSVGGGSREHGVSTNLIAAVDRAEDAGVAVFGVVGAPGGDVAARGDVVVRVAAPASLRTPVVESMQAVVWHALVSHPRLASQPGHWETIDAGAGA